MSIREQLGKVGAASFFDRLVDSEADPVPNLVSTQLLDVLSPLDIRDYLDMALRGGFPEAVHLATERLSRLWLESYIEQLVVRDVPELSGSIDPNRLRRYLAAYASNSAGIVSDTTIYEAAGIDRRTAIGYEHLLESLFVVEKIFALPISSIWQ